MKYFGMLLGMWLLFQKSFQKNMVLISIPPLKPCRSLQALNVSYT